MFLHETIYCTSNKLTLLQVYETKKEGLYDTVDIRSFNQGNTVVGGKIENLDEELTTSALKKAHRLIIAENQRVSQSLVQIT